MDCKVNTDSPNLPWLIVIDAAPVHVAVDRRKRLYNDFPWVKLWFVNAGTRSISQPLHRQIMRPLKHSLQEQCAQSFAAEIMLTLLGGGEFKLDAGLVGNRLRLPNWVEVAMTKTVARVDLCNKAWGFLLVPEKAELRRTWMMLLVVTVWRMMVMRLKLRQPQANVFVTGSTLDGPLPCLRLTSSSVSSYRWFAAIPLATHTDPGRLV
eukprot:3986782-Amphidinium_carterae.2